MKAKLVCRIKDINDKIRSLISYYTRWFNVRTNSTYSLTEDLGNLAFPIRTLQTHANVRGSKCIGATRYLLMITVPNYCSVSEFRFHRASSCMDHCTVFYVRVELAQSRPNNI